MSKGVFVTYEAVHECVACFSVCVCVSMLELLLIDV